MKKLSLLALIPIIYTHASYNIGQILVSSKTSTPQNEFTGDTQIINKEEIESKTSLAQALRMIPGVDLVQSGGPGSVASLSLRGSERRHVLILLNGVRISDRSDIDGGYDIKLIPENMIEKIEILTGSQTLLYGSDAMGGIVNIITKDYSPKASIDIKLGGVKGITTQNTLVKDNLSFFISAFYEEAALVSSSSNGSEIDGYNQKGIYSKLNYTYNTKLSSELIVKSDINDSKLDEYDFSTGKTKDADLSQLTYSDFLGHKLVFENKKLKFDFNTTQNKIARYEISDEKELFEGKEEVAALNLFYQFKNFDLLALLDYSHESFIQSGESEISNEQYGIASSLLFNWSKLHFDIGSRYTKNLITGDNISSSFGAKSNGLGLQLSQGFKSPSLYQLKGKAFGNLVGNPSLEPEKVNTVNVFYEKKSLSLWSFYSKYYDLINFTTEYTNIDEFESHGFGGSYLVEKEAHSLKPSVDILSHNAFSSRVTKRPNQIYRLDYGYKLNDSVETQLQYLYRGVSYEYVNGENRRIEASSVLNLSLEKSLKNLSFRLNIHNVFDDPNQTTYGYNGSPRFYELSVKYHY
jgi:vitamin B12 transporter